MLQDLIVDRSGKTLHLTLNRPDKLNALSGPLVEALLVEIEAACHDGTRLLVLRGSGRCFSAGFDMADVSDQSAGDLVLRFVRIEQLLQGVAHAPFDTLALCHGANFGAGADLAASCARRIGSPDCSFRMPGLQFGLVLGTRRLAARIGGDAARAILGGSRTFRADEALSLGFLTGIVEPDVWLDVIEQAATADALGVASRLALYDLTISDTRDADMAALVRSAAEPGIKDRIGAYLAASRAKKGNKPS